MINELERVVLQVNLPEYNLIKGDIGTVVMIHNEGEGYEVEFMTLYGKTIVVETLLKNQIRKL